ncbi:MAG: ribosomal protein S18-alanine N-acetyltransferase [Xanthomonadales bacterium]|jgi:ribosomal-protein-alanine N-acetyltransferase|nr:ribosomal protein S18-alanine N-acetyltransferase [Xanthomonadales bacterium]
MSEASPRPRIRTLTEDDLPAMLQIERRAYPNPWTEEAFRTCFKAGYSALSLKLGERLIGYGWLTAAAGEAHVLNITVDPELRNQGHGWRLFRRLIDLARWHRVETVFLEVRVSNAPALTLYRRYGFEEIGRRKGYYPTAEGGREDALVMRYALKAPETVG